MRDDLLKPSAGERVERQVGARPHPAVARRLLEERSLADEFAGLAARDRLRLGVALQQNVASPGNHEVHLVPDVAFLDEELTRAHLERRELRREHADELAAVKASEERDGPEPPVLRELLLREQLLRGLEHEVLPGLRRALLGGGSLGVFLGLGAPFLEVFRALRLRLLALAARLGVVVAGAVRGRAAARGGGGILQQRQDTVVPDRRRVRPDAGRPDAARRISIAVIQLQRRRRGARHYCCQATRWCPRVVAALVLRVDGASIEAAPAAAPHMAVVSRG